jgi:hypothetical protein
MNNYPLPEIFATPPCAWCMALYAVPSRAQLHFCRRQVEYWQSLRR